jgi:glycosyltransferase involved in cell wall biosynthesis
MKKRNALVVVSLDGIASMYSGVGTVLHSFFYSWPQFKLRDKYDLYAMTPDFNDTESYNQGIHDLTEKICIENRGKLFRIPTFCTRQTILNTWCGDHRYETITQWESASLSVAATINTFSIFYDKVTVICHDTIFAKVGRYLNSENVSVCWIPHSLSVIFKDHHYKQRMDFELESIGHVKRVGGKIGYISENTRELLVNEFQCADQDLVSFYSGINLNLPKYKSKASVDHYLKKFNIPAGKKVIFSWGRCSYQKGTDIVLKSFIELRKHEQFADYHLILLSPAKTAAPEFMEEVEQLLKKIPASHLTFITEYDDEFPMHFLRYAETKIILLPSRFEGFGLTALEAIALRHKEAQIFYSDIPTFLEAFEGVENSYAVKPDAHAFYEMILNINMHKKVAFQTNGTLPDKFDFVMNHTRALNILLYGES